MTFLRRPKIEFLGTSRTLKELLKAPKVDFFKEISKISIKSSIFMKLFKTF